MAVNKVEINGETKLDLTQDTVTPETLLPGVTAHSADGNAISGAAPVVRYDTAQSLTSAQQAQARENIGAAPGGYGLGESNLKYIASLSELDDIDKNGTYNYYNVSEAIGSYPYGQTGILVHVCSDRRHTQFFFPAQTDTRWWMRTRYNYSKTWGPWEFGKVPMEVGVEYRTTERYQGKPVYKKLQSDNIEYWSIDEGVTWKPKSYYVRDFQFSTTDITAGSSALPDGTVYFVYE